MITMSLIKYFPNSKGTLTYAENIILDYLEKHLADIGKLTITKVAEDNNVSTTTVVRLGKKLNVDSFSRLKYLLEEIYLEQLPQPVDNFYEDIQQNFQLTLKENPDARVQKVASLFQNKIQIYIFAIGLTKACGNYLELALQQLGLNCSLISDHQIIWSFEKTTPNSLAVFLSNSGESEELIRVCERINQLPDSITLAIVNSPSSTLEKVAEHGIHSFVKPVMINKSDFSPHFSLILLIDFLIQSYIQQLAY